MSQLVLGGSLKEFFKLMVEEVVKRQRVSLEEVTEFYVVNLLSEYAAAEKLFDSGSDGRREMDALAVMYHRALQQDRDEKIRTLRRLGDVSLYTAGFFRASLNDRVVGPEYYERMGRNAYGAIADMASNSAFSTVYAELNQKFSTLVDVLGEISARGQCASGPKGQMQVFEAWSRSGNGRLEQVLVETGLLGGNKLLPN